MSTEVANSSVEKLESTGPAVKAEKARLNKDGRVRMHFQRGRRMFAKAVFTGYRRGHHRQHMEQSLLRVDGVFNKDDAKWYLGKSCAYVYKANTLKKRFWQNKPNKTRVMWGKIIKTHGNSGIVRAKFRRNLPPCAMGKRIRVMLYPHRV